MELREYVVICATKPADAGLTKLAKGGGWKKLEKWPPRKGTNRVILWPPYKKPEYERAQVSAFAAAFDDIFADGGWAVYFDEVAYMVDDLKLGGWIRRFWRQGRSLGITVIAATQRPVDVPLDMYSAASWLFLWRTNDRRDLDRIAGLGAAATDDVRREVQSLGPHEVLVVGTRDGSMLRTRVELS
ncbi:MAG: hypothetical protein LC798_05325 [Chloroflexi bacterium]|nr:hypothetical protein [Chloroflexota bacterium]